MDRSLYNDHKNLQEKHWWFRGRSDIVLSLLKKHLGDLRFQRVIDVGSGGGAMIPMLKEFGRHISLLEPDRELGSYLKESMEDKNTSVVINSLEEFKVEEMFDAVSLFDVLEHIEDDIGALQKINSILNIGGYVIITVPAFNFLWSSHDDLNQHKRRYTTHELQEKLQDSGFEIIRMTYFNFFLFPVVFFFRLMDKFKKRKETDFSIGQGLANSLLYKIFRSESRIIKTLNFPFGVSLFALARKKT